MVGVERLRSVAHRKLADELRRLIVASSTGGKQLVGEPLPTALEPAARYGVLRQTARRTDAAGALAEDSGNPPGPVPPDRVAHQVRDGRRSSAQREDPT